MKSTLRTLAFALVASLAGAVAAQNPFWIRGHITVDNCYFGQSIAITQQIYWGGTGNPTTATSNYAVLPSNCSFTWQEGGYGENTRIYFTGTTQCGGLVLTAMDSAQFTSVPDTIDVFFSFACSSSNTPDCLGVPNGNALPGTACTTVLNQPGTWSTNCECVANAPGCQACINLGPVVNPNGNAIPFAVLAENCSQGTTPITYLINWGDGVVNSSGDHAYAAPGAYTVCITITDGSGCTSEACDSLVIDANGTVVLDPSTSYDCLGIANGPNTPGTSCTTPGGAAGTWNASCECVPNVTGCQAGFWVIQAYEADSLNPGSATPIPYELWVWNLSTGTSPFQFEWDFGDGTSSFDAYPTHVYGASGPYNLCLSLSDGVGCSSTYCDSVSIDGDGFYEGMAPESEVRNGFTIRVLNQLPTEVPEQRFNEARVWPNPLTDALNLSFRSTVSGTVPASIIDLNGRVLLQDNLAFARGDNRINLSAAQLAPGMYVLRVGNDAHAMNIRFIKQ